MQRLRNTSVQSSILSPIECVLHQHQEPIELDVPLLVHFHITKGLQPYSKLPERYETGCSKIPMDTNKKMTGIGILVFFIHMNSFMQINRALWYILLRIGDIRSS